MEFSRSKCYAGGYDVYCRDCRYEYNRQYQQQNSEKRKEYQHQRFKRLKTPCPQCGALMWYTSSSCKQCSGKIHGERLGKGLKEWWADDPDGKKRRAISDRAKAQWQDPAYREKMVGVSREHAEKIRGQPLSDEHRLAVSKGLKQAWAEGKWDNRDYNEESKRKRSEAIKQLWQNGHYDNMLVQIHQNPTSLEIDLASVLDWFGLGHVSGYRPEGCSYIYDEYVPELGLLIEVDGEHWHHSEWAKEQGVPEKDARKDQWAADHNYRIVHVRERDSEFKGMKACLAEQLFSQLEF